MQVRIGETNENVPPVVDEREHARRQPAAREIVSREAAPSPLVLHFIEDVFPIATIAIELSEGLCGFIERSDEDRIFVDLGRLADLGEGKLRRPFSSS